MQRSRRAVAGVVMGVGALLLSACSGDAGEPEQAGAGSSTTDTSGTDVADTATGDVDTATDDSDTATDDVEATATANSAPDDTLLVWADVARAEALQEHALAYYEQSGVVVQIQVVADDRMLEQFSQAVMAGAGPDVALGRHYWLGELVQNDVAAPVEFSREVQALFTPESIAATRYDGQTYGLPYAVEGLALIRNTELAPDAPATMEELVDDGKALIAAGDAEHILMQEVGEDGNAYNMYPYLAAYGGGIFPRLDGRGFDGSQVILDSEQTVQGAEKIAWLAQEGALHTDHDASTVILEFAEGDAAYLISGPWVVDQLRFADVNYAIDPIPDFEDGGQTNSLLDVQMFYVSAGSRKPELARAFVEDFVTQPDVQVALYYAGGNRPPALLSAYETVASSDPRTAEWGAAAEGGTPMPNVPGMDAVWGPVGRATADIIEGADVSQRMARAQAQVERLLLP